LKFIKKKSSGYGYSGFGGYGYWFDVNWGEIFLNLNFTGRQVRVRWGVGTRARVHGRRVNEYGYNRFFPKKRDLPFSNPYLCTRLYPSTGTDIVGTGHEYTGTDCTQLVLANPYVKPWSKYVGTTSQYLIGCEQINLPTFSYYIYHTRYFF
jgi:hypothetical protein